MWMADEQLSKFQGSLRLVVCINLPHGFEYTVAEVGRAGPIQNPVTEDEHRWLDEHIRSGRAQLGKSTRSLCAHAHDTEQCAKAISGQAAHER